MEKTNPLYLKQIDNIKSDKDFEAFVIQSCGPEKFLAGLSRVRNYLAQSLKLIQNSGVKIVTIAGTNGKGETAFALEHILCKQGFKTALWTSPHVVSICERFVFNGLTISLEKIISHTKKILEKHSGFPSLSYYEFLFAIFCEEVVRCTHETCDNFVIILEVGLGGLLDAVNLFDADLVGITSISRDHQEILGNRYELILKEKLGVARAKKIVVSNFFTDYLHQATEKILRDLDCTHVSLSKLKITTCDMDYHTQNRLMASTIASLITIKKNISYLDDYMSIGRWQVVTRGDKRFILVGSHNCDGMRELVKRVRNSQTDSHFDLLILGFSKREPHDVLSMLKIVTHNAPWDKILLTTFRHPRAFEKDELKKVYDKFINECIDSDNQKAELIEFIEDDSSLYNKIFENQGIKKILAAGSYYFVASILKKFAP